MLNVRVENTIIPTYEVGKPDKNPLFLDKRVYQASSGKIYPYPMIDKIYDEKIDKNYETVTLENEFIEIMVIPSLGGRIQYGYDKKNDYYFFYNNEVIKPALVGLCGPWLSGGVEFNWPQHHRPSTFSSVEFEIENGDGYAIVWLNELEIMSQLTGVAGVKIFEDSNRVEVIGKSINNTNLPKTFLWWANIAVHCHEEYESFFPRDVKFVADHGKREVTSYPYANSQYYNVDYPNLPIEKRNITNYDNIKVPMSYMAVGSKYDFFGGFDFKKEIGTMHISNTHTAPGKKQWTWGSGDFGQAWDRHLTDENGPYIELMAGVYTDNQPDFTWINPGETKEFKQTWYPFTQIGKALNANELIAYNIIDGKLLIYSTVNQEVEIKIEYNTTSIDIYEKTKLNVGETFAMDLADENAIKRICINQLEYTYNDSEDVEFQPAIEAMLPEDVKSQDELYNIGIHLEQYRHATRNPIDYYNQMLKYDPKDARANERLGYIYLEKGQLYKAQEYFKCAISTLTKYNPNPKECGSYFGLASVYKLLNNDEQAYKNYYKSFWDIKYKAKSMLEIAKIDFKANNFELAYEHIKESLKYDSINLQALALEQKCLEIKGETPKYDNLILNQSFNYYARFFRNTEKFLEYIGANDKTVINLVEFLDEIGFTEEAIELISVYKSNHPILQMYLANNGYEYSSEWQVEGIFPYTVFEKLQLEKYLSSNESYDASYLLSILLIDKGEKDVAYELLNKCRKSGYKNSVFLRVLGLLEYNLNRKQEKTRECYLEAIASNPEDSRLVYEYDQLRKILNDNPKERIGYLKENMHFVEYRDDLKTEFAWLLCQLGEFEQCINFMEVNKFHPFEGGEGKVIEVYKTAKMAVARKFIKAGDFKAAYDILNFINDIPECLGEGIIDGSPNADVLYYTALCLEMLGDKKSAQVLYQECVDEQVITSSKLSYKPEKLQMNYFQALAYEKIGDYNAKESIINDLRSLALEKLELNVGIDYFAISVPEFTIFDVDLNEINQAHCYYLLALCELANGNKEKASEYVEKSKAINCNKLELVNV